MKKRILISAIITLVFLSAGFALLHYELIGYGFSFFVFLPFLLGFLLGKPALRRGSMVGLIIALMLFLIMLLAGGLEGMVCVFMSLPIIAVMILIGYLIREFFRKGGGDGKPGSLLKASILPMAIFLGIGLVERWLVGDDKVVEEVRSQVVLPYTPVQVYDAIKSVDTLVAPKAFLMGVLDLPVPNKCILEKEAVGGLRTCYFTGGHITEKITQLEPAKVLRMDVVEYKLTGRKWLGFREAIYFFEPVGRDSCRLTRATTYTSKLTPRPYWAPLERWGIEEEHQYVFNNLKRDLRARWGR